MRAPTRQPAARRTWWLVVGLLILSPICAEYVSAYDESTGHPSALLGNLVIFIPLYGCAALLNREVARRARLGWTGILVLAVVFGLVEAGLVDQSLFSPDYRGLEGWDAMFQATLIGPVGLSASNLIGFVGGHVMLSICGPIALVEGWQPARATEPWLRVPGLVITALAYAGASVAVLLWHLQTESWHASTAQLIGTGLVVILLVAAAVRLGHRELIAPRRGGPGLVRTAVVALVLALAYAMVPQTWPGVAAAAALLLTGGLLLHRGSRTTRWGATHAAVVGAAPLIATALLAFTYDPLIGQVSATAKYCHNVAMLVILLAALAAALARRDRSVAPVTDRVAEDQRRSPTSS